MMNQAIRDSIEGFGNPKILPKSGTPCSGEGSGVTSKVLDGLSHKGLNEGSGVNKEDEANPHKSDAEKKDKEMEDIDEQAGKYHAMDEQAVNVQDEMSIDEVIAQGELDPAKTLKRHPDHDQYPPAYSKKKRKKRKSKDTESSKNDKDITNSLKKAPVQDADWAVDDMPHDDVAPKQDNSKWFKQPVIERAESLDPEWHKQPNSNDAPK
ncbi:hypothetical protein Tco_0791971 [Tanacetum coccineum]